MTPAAPPRTESLRATPKVWQLQPHDRYAIEQLGRALQISPIVAQLLLNRKVVEPALARTFLSATLTGLHEPELLPGVVRAVNAIFAAIADRKKICIYGDYDVDGVTGTAILLGCLKLLDANVDYYVPHRLDEGYGLSLDALRKLASDGVQVLITVDCGITSVAEALEARRLGVTLIVTDHHEPKAEYPDADVLVHPRLPLGSQGTTAAYPCGFLSGAGVAFKLAWALCKRKCGSDKVTPVLREYLLDAIVLAAMGTVADVVPLFDENRIFVRHGVSRMKTQPTIGLRSLLRSAKLEGKAGFGATDIGYGLAPRINAAGRLGTARLAVELMTTTSAQRADVLADYLERQNQERQLMERRLVQEAREMAEQNLDHPAFVLANANWHPGLLGIVASRLVDFYARPVLMISLRDGQPAQGSGRSVPGFRLHEALQECTGHLLSHGGHATAAGFRLEPERIPLFREQFHDVVGRHFGAMPPAHRLVIDAEVPLSALTFGLVDAINKLEPYGAGNPQPILLADRLQVVKSARVGNGERHLSIRVRQENREVRGIAFGMADRLDELMSQGGQCCMAFTPRINEWNGFRNVEIEVRDFQAGSTPTFG